MSSCNSMMMRARSTGLKAIRVKVTFLMGSR
jgi:hypothetical protein